MAALQTIEAGTLLVASAFPDPPFEVVKEGVDTGFDAELMRAVCGQSGSAGSWQVRGRRLQRDLRRPAHALLRRRGVGHDGHPEREKVALFSEPYLESDQSLVVNTT